jgi:hypothetical protein
MAITVVRPNKIAARMGLKDATTMAAKKPSEMNWNNIIGTLHCWGDMSGLMSRCL